MTLHTPVYVQPTVGDANFPNGIPFTAQELRRNLQAMLSVTSASSQVGVTPLDGQFAVTQHAGGANFSVDVAAGHAFVLGTDVANQSVYGCWNDGVVNVTTPSPPASGTEVHRLVLQVEDKLNNGVFTGYTANLTLLADTGSGTPAAPASSITLALISISAGQASVLNANITDQRPILGALSLPATATPQTINSTAAQTITGCTSTVAARPYRIKVVAQFTGNQAAGNPSFQIAGPASSSLWGNAHILDTANGSARDTADTSGLLFQGPVLSTNNWEVSIDAYAVFTAAGPISLQAFTSLAADTYKILNAVLDLIPA